MPTVRGFKGAMAKALSAAGIKLPERPKRERRSQLDGSYILFHAAVEEVAKFWDRMAAIIRDELDDSALERHVPSARKAIAVIQSYLTNIQQKYPNEYKKHNPTKGEN